MGLPLWLFLLLIAALITGLSVYRPPKRRGGRNA